MGGASIMGRGLVYRYNEMKLGKFVLNLEVIRCSNRCFHVSAHLVTLTITEFLYLFT